MFANCTYLPATPDSLDAALDGWRGAAATHGALMLLPEAERLALPALQAIFRARGIPLVGAIFPKLMHGEEFCDHGAWLFGLDPMPAHFLLDRLGSGNRTAHSRISVAARERKNGAQKPTLFLIFDAMVPNIGSILDGVYRSERSGFLYAGVNAGSESFQAMPCLFDGDQVIGDGVLGLVLPDQIANSAHGYPVAKSLMQATSAVGNRIELIDRRPAMDVYRDMIAAEFGIALTPENFYDYAVHFPFGVVSALDVMVRIPVGFDPDGSIYCVGEVPNQAILRLLRAPDPESNACIDTLADALPPRHGRDWLLTFYCAGRRMHFGTAANDELGRLAQATGASALAGALSLGEITTNTEFAIPEFHNAAIVCL